MPTSRPRAAPDLQEQVDLKAFNTFGVSAKAAYFSSIDSLDALQATLQHPRVRGLPRLVLGGGSNLLLTRDFPGLVLHMQLFSKRVRERDANATYVEAAAGENWHGFVQWTLEENLTGLENLSLIPGLVGASPMQNIGAYGVEMKDTFSSLEAFDLVTGELRRFDSAACEFGYRDSVFKQRAKDRYIILSARFRLPLRAQLHLEYGELRGELAHMNIASPTARHVGTAVCNIRRRKLPDPAVIGNAGSFFKNPVVADAAAAELALRYPSMPRYPGSSGHTKLAAGWLIEQAGWKGKRAGDAGVHERHALVLVNHGTATGAQILALAREIQDSVMAEFGIELEPEPIIV